MRLQHLGLLGAGYGHPRDVLTFFPQDLSGRTWYAAAGAASWPISLEHEPRPQNEVRILTGRGALRYQAPREWISTVKAAAAGRRDF